MAKAEAPGAARDRRLMAVALSEAEAGAAEGGYPVGAVLARGDDILAQGHNLTAQLSDPTAHGETVCLRGAPEGDLSDTVLYTTLSPCIMCAGTVLWLGVGRVVIGDARHYSGNEDFLRARGVTVDVLEDEGCLRMFAAYLARTPEHRFNDDA